MVIDATKCAVILLAMPLAYATASYMYVALWHRRLSLWNTVIHENGRLTLKGSLFYFDHFLCAVPKIMIYALVVSGGFALSVDVPFEVRLFHAGTAAAVLLGSSGLLVLVAFIGSVRICGWQRTVDYALNRIERDGVMSRGGSWNQMQESNIPLYLVMFSTSYAAGRWMDFPGLVEHQLFVIGGLVCIVVALSLWVIVSVYFWPGFRAFSNPRWIAHGIREVATQPFTTLPFALLGILLVVRYLYGSKHFLWRSDISYLAIILFGLGVLIVVGQVVFLSRHSIRDMAQKPAFAPEGLSIPYLLCSHVFEHFLDFVFIFVLSGGIFCLIVWLSL